MAGGMDTYKIVFSPTWNTERSAYLILCKESVPPDQQDFRGCFRPSNPKGANILVAEKRYWLFYSGMASRRVHRCSKTPESTIGLAVADSPEGPWTKTGSNPVLRTRGAAWWFGDVQARNPCPLVREGKYWLYYERSQAGLVSIPPAVTLAIAGKPEGPYAEGGYLWSLMRGGDVMVWPLGPSVAAWVGSGEPGTASTLQYAADGRRFSAMQNLQKAPTAGGVYRPEAFTDSEKGQMVDWGLKTHFPDEGLPFIERFDCRWQ